MNFIRADLFYGLGGDLGRNRVDRKWLEVSCDRVAYFVCVFVWNFENIKKIREHGLWH